MDSSLWPSVFSAFWSFLIFVSLLRAGCRHSASDNGGLTKIVFQADWYPQPEHGGFYTALAKGFYKDEGLDVTILPGGPYITVEKQVSAGARSLAWDLLTKFWSQMPEGIP